MINVQSGFVIVTYNRVMIVGKFYIHALLNLFGEFVLSVVYVIGG